MCHCFTTINDIAQHTNSPPLCKAVETVHNTQRHQHYKLNKRQLTGWCMCYEHLSTPNNTQVSSLASNSLTVKYIIFYSFIMFLPQRWKIQSVIKVHDFYIFIFDCWSRVKVTVSATHFKIWSKCAWFGLFPSASRQVSVHSIRICPNIWGTWWPKGFLPFFSLLLDLYLTYRV